MGHRINKLYDIVDNILSEHEVQNLSKDKERKKFRFTIDKDGRHLDVDVIICTDRVDVMCIYPFKVQSNTAAIISLFMAMTNYYVDGYYLKFNPLNGSIWVETGIPVGRKADVDNKDIWCGVNDTVEYALDEFLILSNYSVGKLPDNEREKYTWLLISSIDALNGDRINYLSIVYGTEDFEEDFLWKKEAIDSFDKWVSKTRDWYANNLPFC